jgi:hypothetical protein
MLIHIQNLIPSEKLGYYDRYVNIALGKIEKKMPLSVSLLHRVYHES